MIGEHWIARQQSQELPACHDEQFRRGHGAGARGARPPIEQRDLAEGVTRFHDVEKHLPAAGGTRADAHSAGDHAKQGIPGVRLRKDHGIGLVAAAYAESRNLIERRGQQPTKQQIALEHRAYTDRHMKSPVAGRRL